MPSTLGISEGRRVAEGNLTLPANQISGGGSISAVGGGGQGGCGTRQGGPVGRVLAWGVKRVQIRLSSLPYINCVSLGKSLNPSGPPHPHLGKSEWGRQVSKDPFRLSQRATPTATPRAPAEGRWVGSPIPRALAPRGRGPCILRPGWIPCFQPSLQPFPSPLRSTAAVPKRSSRAIYQTHTTQASGGQDQFQEQSGTEPRGGGSGEVSWGGDEL